jgi:hypothetical protein
MISLSACNDIKNKNEKVETKNNDIHFIHWFDDINIGMTKGDVKFRCGVPNLTKISRKFGGKDSVWTYYKGRFSYSVLFKNEKVKHIVIKTYEYDYDGNSIPISIDFYYINNKEKLYRFDNVDSMLKYLGSPDTLIISKDELNRIYLFNKYGVWCLLCKKIIYELGKFDKFDSNFKSLYPEFKE